MYGLDQDDWELVESLLIEPLSESANLYVFGSRAIGTHKRYSDLDVLVKPNNEADISFLLSEIKEDLEKSALSIKIDLVLENHLASSYREQIYQNKILLNQK